MTGETHRHQPLRYTLGGAESHPPWVPVPKAIHILRGIVVLSAQKIDEERRVLCRERNVRLIEVPYFAPIDEVYSLILTQLDSVDFEYPAAANKLSPSPDGVYARTEMARLREAASEFGHTLVSKIYKGSAVPLDFRCSHGHVFPRRPASLHRGQTNCPTCVSVKQKTIEDMQDYAMSRGAVCLSKIYVNNKRSLVWHCLAHDHRFELYTYGKSISPE